MNRPLAILALTGFILSLLVHIAALCSINVADKLPLIWLLHAGIFVVFIPMILSARKNGGAKPGFALIRASFPAWVVAVGFCLFVYVSLNFMLSMSGLEGTPTAQDDGKYVLQNRSKVIREITLSEYTAGKAREVRMFSGHWLLFYFVPFAYFMFYRKPEDGNIGAG